MVERHVTPLESHRPVPEALREPIPAR